MTNRRAILKASPLLPFRLAIVAFTSIKHGTPIELIARAVSRLHSCESAFPPLKRKKQPIPLSPASRGGKKQNHTKSDLDKAHALIFLNLMRKRGSREGLDLWFAQ